MATGIFPVLRSPPVAPCAGLQCFSFILSLAPLKTTQSYLLMVFKKKPKKPDGTTNPRFFDSRADCFPANHIYRYLGSLPPAFLSGEEAFAFFPHSFLPLGGFLSQGPWDQCGADQGQLSRSPHIIPARNGSAWYSQGKAASSGLRQKMKLFGNSRWITLSEVY